MVRLLTREQRPEPVPLGIGTQVLGHPEEAHPAGRNEGVVEDPPEVVDRSPRRSPARRTRRSVRSRRCGRGRACVSSRRSSPTAGAAARRDRRPASARPASAAGRRAPRLHRCPPRARPRTPSPTHPRRRRGSRSRSRPRQPPFARPHHGTTGGVTDRGPTIALLAPESFAPRSAPRSVRVAARPRSGPPARGSADGRGVLGRHPLHGREGGRPRRRTPTRLGGGS